jgi:hypothetical protein
VARRYGDFAKLHRRLRTEFPGKSLPVLPRKNKTSTASSFFSSADDDASSVSSLSSQSGSTPDEGQNSRNSLAPGGYLHRSASRSSMRSALGKSPKSPRASGEVSRETVLYREEQRVSLRAFLRTLLQNKRAAESKALEEFLTGQPVTLNEEELIDMQRRKEADAIRIEEQKRFYEIARQRAAELDVYMENFRRDIVESSKCYSPNTQHPSLTVLFLPQMG